MSTLLDDLATALDSASPALFMCESIKDLIAALILEVLDYLAGWCRPDIRL